VKRLPWCGRGAKGSLASGVRQSFWRQHGAAWAELAPWQELLPVGSAQAAAACRAPPLLTRVCPCVLAGRNRRRPFWLSQGAVLCRRGTGSALPCGGPGSVTGVGRSKPTVPSSPGAPGGARRTQAPLLAGVAEVGLELQPLRCGRCRSCALWEGVL